MRDKLTLLIFYLLITFVLLVVFTPYILVFITGEIAFLALYIVWIIPIAIALVLFYFVIKFLK